MSGVWARSAEEAPLRVRSKIDTSKVLVSVFWGTNWMILLDALPPGQRFNTSYMCDVILPKLDQAVRLHRPVMGLRGMKLHFDNARPHISGTTLAKIDELRAAKLPQPPYFPDLAPSDLYLLSLNSRAQRFRTPKNLRPFEGNFCSHRTKSSTQRVRRVENPAFQVIELGGEYYH